jgi:hypothetical protein
MRRQMLAQHGSCHVIEAERRPIVRVLVRPDTEHVTIASQEGLWQGFGA